MSLLREIQEATTGPSENITSALRKAKVLATRLDFAPLREWANHELGGYPKEVDLPIYRRFHVTSRGKFTGYFGTRLDNALLANSNIPEKYREMLTICEARQGLGEYIDLLTRADKDLAEFWPSELVTLLSDRFYKDMTMYEAHKMLPRSNLIHIIEAVQDRLLNFALDIEKSFPNAGDIVGSDSAIPASALSHTFHVTINNQGDNNIAIGSNDFAQTVNASAVRGDFDELRDDLVNALGIPNEEVEKLRAILKDEPQEDKKTMGPRLKEWLGNVFMLGVNGFLKVEGPKAAEHTSKALNHFFGWQ